MSIYSSDSSSPTFFHRLMPADTEREHLFEKSLTPSDVGKLNRLVIPKQHAEKYFPLSGENSCFLLSFEDEAGKSWNFRYSYWNSSQSYVLTKGWSRFVKEKRLHAADFVVFSRHRADATRLFIGWRRRNSAGAAGIFYGPYPNQQACSTPPSHQPAVCLHSAPTSGKSKKVRLFGVNLECQADESAAPAEGGTAVSGQQHLWLQQYYVVQDGQMVHNPAVFY